MKVTHTTIILHSHDGGWRSFISMGTTITNNITHHFVYVFIYFSIFYS
jgi:hypothetical protein